MNRRGAGSGFGSTNAVCTILMLLCFSGWLASQEPATRQNAPSPAKDRASIPLAIADLEKGDFGLVDIEIIAEAKAVQAIPLLENQYEKSTDEDTKEKIANALVRLGGDPSGKYWDLLAAHADEVLKSDAPDPFAYKPDGTAVPEPSPQFVNWAESHNLDLSTAMRNATFEATGAILDIATTDDPRSIPFLRQAVQSQNHMVAIVGARGLAELKDSDSVNLIINAARHAPKEAAAGIAKALVYFDTPEAQQAFDEFVPKEAAKVLREARSQGQRPLK